MVGYVKDWNRMLDEFFNGEFFEVDWMFLPNDEALKSIAEDEEDIGRISLRQRLKEEKDEVQRLRRVQLEWLEGTIFGIENDVETIFDAGNDSDAESFALIDDIAKTFAMVKHIEGAMEIFERNEEKLGCEAEKHEDDRFDIRMLLRDSEGFEKILGGMMKNDVAGEALKEEMTYGAFARMDKMLNVNEVWTHEGINDGGYAKERERITLNSERVEKILNGFKNEANTDSREIKIEMVRNDGYRDEFDMDMAVDKLTERLCEMMSKGADGFYL